MGGDPGQDVVEIVVRWKLPKVGFSLVGDEHAQEEVDGVLLVCVGESVAVVAQCGLVDVAPVALHHVHFAVRLYAVGGEGGIHVADQSSGLYYVQAFT